MWCTTRGHDGGMRSSVEVVARYGASLRCRNQRLRSFPSIACHQNVLAGSANSSIPARVQCGKEVAGIVRTSPEHQNFGPQAQTSAGAANPAASIGATLAARRTPAVESGKWRSFSQEGVRVPLFCRSQRGSPNASLGAVADRSSWDGWPRANRPSQAPYYVRSCASQQPNMRTLQSAVGGECESRPEKTCRFALSSLQTLKIGS